MKTLKEYTNDYIDYLYGEERYEEMYAPEVKQSKVDFRAGFNLAKELSNWNNVNEKLPDNDRTVLVYKNDTETPHWSGYDLGTYQNEKWYLNHGRPSHVIVERWKEIE